MPVLPVMATLAQPARNTLKPTDVSRRLTYPCTYRAVPETLVYWADVRPRAAGSVGGGRAEEAGSRPRTGGSYALAANTVCESAATIHGPRRSIEPTQLWGGRPTLDCGVIEQGRRAGHHPRGWVK